MTLILAAAAALAGQAADPQLSVPIPPAPTEAAREDDPIIVKAPLLLPSVGLMNDHLHGAGEMMIGLRFERARWSGANRSGTDRIADAAILAAGFTSRTRRMTMDMAMLDVMVAPTDTITLMVMPHYMWHRMEMVGIDPGAGEGGGAGGGHGGHGGHALGFGEVHRHSTEGFGDTLASASVRLAKTRRFKAHATLGLWIPTGASDRRNPDGTFVHYGMQPGGGTWDVEPSATVSGGRGRFGWGAQAAYRWRVSEANASGFRFGDRTRLNGWVSMLLGASLGATARLEYANEGRVEGHYNGAHSHSAPPDRQENYGGETVTGALGFNWRPPLWGAFRPEIGVELGMPIYQKLNGIQAPQDWRLSTAIRRTF